MNISLTTLAKGQYTALMDVYGPPENVHYMIMAARPKDGKFILEGNEDDFEGLLNIIIEEIGEGLCSKKNLKPLLGVCKKVDPESLDWIGM